MFGSIVLVALFRDWHFFHAYGRTEHPKVCLQHYQQPLPPKQQILRNPLLLSLPHPTYKQSLADSNDYSRSNSGQWMAYRDKAALSLNWRTLQVHDNVHRLHEADQVVSHLWFSHIKITSQSKIERMDFLWKTGFEKSQIAVFGSRDSRLDDLKHPTQELGLGSNKKMKVVWFFQGKILFYFWPRHPELPSHTRIKNKKRELKCVETFQPKSKSTLKGSPERLFLSFRSFENSVFLTDIWSLQWVLLPLLLFGGKITKDRWLRKVISLESTSKIIENWVASETQIFLGRNMRKIKKNIKEIIKQENEAAVPKYELRAVPEPCTSRCSK